MSESIKSTHVLMITKTFINNSGVFDRAPMLMYAIGMLQNMQGGFLLLSTEGLGGAPDN